MSVDVPARCRVPHEVFRADVFAAHERFDVWRESVMPLFESRLDAQPAPAGFQAHVESFNLQALFFCISGFSPLSFHRAANHAARLDPDGGDHLLVQLYLKGGYAGYNGASALRVGPGDISLLDLGRALETRAPASEVLSLVVPRGALTPLLDPARLRPGTVLKAGSPLATILSSHLRTVWRSLPSVTMDEVPAINATLLGTLAGAFGGAPGRRDELADAMEMATLQAVRDYIHHHLDDDELSPAALCRRFACSRSRLYRLFEPLGGIAGYIREQRLRRCFEALTRPDGPRPRIIDVAMQWGFDSQSHFSRLFRQQFGITPSDAHQRARDQWRQQAARERAADATPQFRDWLRRL
ncbi:AraC family transcriptional regulator [Alcanivorax sp. N3-2A]|nr:AraC family transcriptional regulator [Alcanivorax sp. N3-2A]|tara:strand:- start:44851 stop:45915 length:1065 start_codon:yes stop_codon:yes gene_type:complete